MADLYEKQPPAPIRHAMAALETLRAEDAALAAALEKTLPAYAMRLSQSGAMVDIQSLLDISRQGETALKEAFTRLRSSQDNSTLLEKYLKIKKEFNDKHLETIKNKSAPDPATDPDGYRKFILCEAAREGDLEKIASLFDHDNSMLHFRDAALHAAAEHGQTTAVELLLKRGARIDSNNGDTKNNGYALKLAASNGHTKTVEFLLDQGANLHIHDDLPLRLATRHGKTETALLLMARGADLHILEDIPLRQSACNGHIETLTMLLDRGANINAHGDEALFTSAANGHIDIVSLLLERGANIHTSGAEVIGKAAINGHIEIVKLLLDHGTDIYAAEALRMASVYGHANMVMMLLERGTDVNSNNGIALTRAAGHSNVELVAYLLDHGADIRAGDDGALRWAALEANTETVKLLLERGANISAIDRDSFRLIASRGRTETVKLLLEYGADIRLNNYEIVHHAAELGRTQILQLFLDHDADAFADKDALLQSAMKSEHKDTAMLLLDRRAKMTALDTKQQAALQSYSLRRDHWRQTVRIDPPLKLESYDPTPFKAQLFTSLVQVFEEDGYYHTTSHYYRYAAIAVFQNEQRLFQYLQKWGTVGKQPLHDLLHMIKLPQDLSGINLSAWGDAILQHGPKMAHLIKFCDRLPQPLRSEDDKSWSYLRTRAEVAKFAYNRAAEHPQLAALCFENTVDEEDFNAALEIVQAVPPKVRDMPEITIDGARFGLEGATFHKLANNDVRGLFLGELTDCCQSIGNHGHACAEHGYTSPNGGFYAIETKNGEIIGQSWAWRGNKGELCFDSLETLGKRVSEQQWGALLDEAAKELTARTDHGVSALHVGTGGATPKSLQIAFRRAEARPIDYSGYRDSKTQIQVWKR